LCPVQCAPDKAGILVIKKINWFFTNRRLSASLKGRKLAILYHYVGDRLTFNAKFHAVTTAAFKKQLLDFKKSWQFTDEEDFFDGRDDGAKPKIILTFDDGYKDTLNNVSGFLAEEKIPFIFFINKVPTEGKILWRDKIRAIISSERVEEFVRFSGLAQLTAENFYTATKDPDELNSKLISDKVDQFCMQHLISVADEADMYCTIEDIKKHIGNPYLKVGNHSANHFCLSTLNYAEQQDEILTCDAFIKSHFSQEKVSRIFSTPFGSYKSFNEDTTSILSEAGYRATFISVPGDYQSRSSELSLNGHPIPGYKRFLPKHYFRLH
jgi:peptidoglycan/xylan/chitin deacetylase (PgdA/CDA1 family)